MKFLKKNLKNNIDEMSPPIFYFSVNYVFYIF